MSESTFKILITTDNHLGFAERDRRRGDDSFTTFEEVLRAARTEHDVDAMLLGGDLFHENKPSLGCLVRACSLLRKYVLGDKPLSFSLLSDPATTFPTHAVPLANVQDPNMNVALPIFAIHGNHDDPVGGTSSLDLLATNGYLNYLGHVTSLDDIALEPVLLRKGSTFIALYGLGNVRDERLHRCFRQRKVQFIHPTPVPGRRWFNILLLHQNRGVRGAASKNGILESMLAGFGMDLVLWGNEHEQLMVPQPADGFDVVQPGSTVMTSLSAQECNPKQYGILEVRGTSYRLTPYPLRSVRPVVRRTVELREELPDGRTLDAVETYLHGVMRDMIGEAEELVRRIPDEVLHFHPNLKYPLVRLAVDFTDVSSAPYPQPNFNRFGQQYMDVVANPGELLRPVKPKPERRAEALLWRGGAGAAGGPVVPAVPQLNTLDIRAKVADVFNHNTKNACTLLSESELSAAVYAFAEKGERDAIDERLAELLHTSQRSVWRRLENGANDSILKPDRVVEEVVTHKRHVNERYARAAQLEDAQQQQQQQRARDTDGDGGADEEEEAEAETEATRGASSTAAVVGHRARRGPALDAFDAVRIAGPHAAHATGVDDDNGDRDDRLVQTSVSRLVQRAIGGAADAEDGGEELPEDGLDRVPIESLIANAVQQAGPPSKRPRSAADAADVVATALRSEGGEEELRRRGPESANAVHVVDADDDGGDAQHVHEVDQRGGRRAGAATAPARKERRTVSARRGAAGGRRGAPLDGSTGPAAVTAAAGGGGSVPTLTFVPHHGGSAAPNTASAAPAAAGSAATAPMLNLLSRWTGGSQQR
ncbi:endo/exonuclease Mre11 [Novymonas esmeraldas]|uniref:Endo/exonuclease Mre11 n=1 Tax=Novymonas esmeraldas TaxID=1808958 RepID=A0AAW0ES07_9TRYP